MEENTVLAQEEELNIAPDEEIMPDAPDYDPEEWERKRREAEEAALAPFKALRAAVTEHDELMAETLYELTMLELEKEG